MADHTLLIQHIHARQVLDSRGTPTVEVEVRLEGGMTAAALVPSGASTGQAEALELRDGNPLDHAGKSVHRAVDHVHQVLAPALLGLEATEQSRIDETMIALDGTPAEVFAEPTWPTLASTYLEPPLAARVGARLGLGPTPTEDSLVKALVARGSGS